LALTRRAADGSTPAEVLGAKGVLRTMTPDGQHIVVTREGQATSWDLWLASPDGELVPFIVEPGMQGECAFSQDGKWVAYRSIDDGRSNLFVCPYPNVMDEKRRVPGGGNPSRPIWSQDGSELFFIRDGVNLMAAPIATTPALTIGEPELLFADLNASLESGTEYAPMPDGQRFLVIKEDPAFLRPRPELHVVVNWIEELKAKMRP
jgi:Tol biopolymer transport system component